MTQILKLLASIGLMLFLSACSTASIISSWHNPEVSTKVSRPYIIGISKDDTKRRVFEDSARAKLMAEGVSPIASYQNLPTSEENDKAVIGQKAAEKGADSILIVRVIDRRTETRVQPGRVTTQVTAPVYPGTAITTPPPFPPDSHYHDYGRYYARSYEVVYEPPREIHFKVGTVEANLYDSRTDQLLWSGQFKVVEDSFDKVVNDFVDCMTGELKRKGLI